MSHDEPSVRPEDVQFFLEVYERTTGKGYTRHKSFRSLLGEDKYTTWLKQLGRIADFADTIDLPGSRRQPHSGRSEGQPLHLLFEPRAVGDGGLQPTKLADALYMVFSNLIDVYGNLRRQTALLLEKSCRQVHAGAAQTFFFHVCPFVFSQWKEKGVLGDLMDLTWTTGNTRDLLPKLNAGVLDFVLGYGLNDEQGVFQTETNLDIAFSSFGYDSKMILACHPTEPLWLKSGQDHNKGYYEFLEECEDQDGPDGERAPAYAQLREIDLEEMQPRRTSLIITDSWAQPPALQDFLNRARDQGMTVLETSSYEEAAARVKLQLGMAILPEVYSKRRMINAFRLTPRAGFTRWIGAYYSTRFPLAQETYTALELLRHYFRDCAMSVRNGRPVGYGSRVRVKSEGKVVEKDFTRWCQDFRIEGDWLAGARTKYPLRDVAASKQKQSHGRSKKRTRSKKGKPG